MPIKELESEKEKVAAYFQECSPIFVALGDSIRQKLILEIAESDNDGVNINYLVETTKLTRPAVIYHLKFLLKCGLVRTEKRGNMIFYFLGLEEKISLIKEFIDSLKNLLSEKEKHKTVC